MAGIEYRKDWDVLASYFAFKELASAPATPETNVLRLYAKDSGGISTLCYKNDAGTEICLPTSGSFVTGTGVANRLAYWTGASTIDDVPRTFTAGSVLFAGSDFLPQEDNANLFYDDTNNRLGIGTNAPSQLLHVLGTARFDFATGQAYDIARRTGDLRLLTIQAQTSGAPHNIELYTKDGDGTDNMSVNMFAKGLPTSVTDRELLQLNYDTSGPFFAVVSDAGGTGTVRPLKLYTGANTTQLVLNIDGTSSLSGHVIIGGGATASELRLLEPAGGGSSYTSFKSPALAANVNYTLPVDDGTAGQVLTTDGAGVLSWGAAGGNHNLLDGSVHGDTVAQTVSRGSLIYGNATPKWDELVVGSAGAFLRNDGTDAMWSTLILPNAATANRVVFASGANTYGEDADMTFDGTDLALGTGSKFKMQGQNRIRYHNAICIAARTTAQSITTGTVTLISFNGTDIVDTDSMHDPAGANPSRISANLTGKYVAFLYGLFDVSAGPPNGERGFFLEKNSAGSHSAAATQVGSVNVEGTALLPEVSIACFVDMTSGDYIEGFCYQNSGGNLDLAGDVITCKMGLAYIGE